MKSKKFPIDIFKHGIKVVIGTKEELISVAKKDRIYDEIKDDIDTVHNSFMVTFMLSSGDSLIYSKDYKNDIEYASVVAHEIIHAVSHILRNVGIAHTAETEEVYAYTIEDLAKRILTWLISEFP